MSRYDYGLLRRNDCCIDPGSRGCFVPDKRTMCTRNWTRTSIRPLTVLLAQAAGVVEEPPALTCSLAIGNAAFEEGPLVSVQVELFLGFIVLCVSYVAVSRCRYRVSR